MKKSKKLKKDVYLPYSILAINKQVDILKSLVDKYHKEHRAISYKDIGGIHASKANVSGSLSFYANIGWLIKSGTEYTPSENLIHYFKGLNKEKSQEELSQLLLQNCNIAKEITFFIKQKPKSDRENLIKYLGTKFDFLEKDKRALNRLIDLLITLEIINTDEEGRLFQEEMRQDVPSITESQEKQREQVETKVMSISEVQEGINICIGIILSPEMNEDYLRKSIRIVLEEVKKLRGK